MKSFCVLGSLYMRELQLLSFERLIFTPYILDMIVLQGWTHFPKNSRSHLQNFRRHRVDVNNSHTNDPQILNANVQN